MNRHERRKQAKYMKKVLELEAKAPLKPGEIGHITVMHDNWCELLVSGGACNCDPQVRYGTPDEGAIH